MGKIKKIAISLMLVASMLAMSLVCCAASGDQAAFVTDITTGLAPDEMWGAVRPFSSLMIGIFLFAFGYNIFKKVTKKGSKGKYGV